MKAPFGPGDVVACVKPDFRGRLKISWKYTVDEIGGAEGTGIRLSGGPNCIKGELTESGLVCSGFWSHWRFRLYEPPKLEAEPTERKTKKPKELQR